MESLYPLSRYIAGIYRLSKNNFNQQIAQLDIRATQSDVLLFIAEHDGLDQKSIAKQMAIAPGLVTKDLRILEKQGLINRFLNPDDSRCNQVFITDLGSELVNQLRQIMNHWWYTQLINCNKIDHPSVFIQQLQALYQKLLYSNEVDAL